MYSYHKVQLQLQFVQSALHIKWHLLKNTSLFHLLFTHTVQCTVYTVFAHIHIIHIHTIYQYFSFLAFSLAWHCSFQPLTNRAAALHVQTSNRQHSLRAAQSQSSIELQTEEIPPSCQRRCYTRLEYKRETVGSCFRQGPVFMSAFLFMACLTLE